MSDDFMEEKCAPVRRGKQELPSQLKPKFPATKTVEQPPPAKSIEYPAPKTIENPPPVSSKPSELLTPPQQKDPSPNLAPTPPCPPQQNAQNAPNPPNPPNGPVVPPETAAAPKKMDSQEKDLPSDVNKPKLSADQEDGQKKKKKPKQPPPKKDGEAAQAVFFMEEGENNGTNAVGTFVEENDGEDEKKKKKKEKEVKKVPKAPTPRQGCPKTEQQPKTELSLRAAKKKDQPSSRQTPMLKRKEEEKSGRSLRLKKNAAVTSNFQKREPGSARPKQQTGVVKVILPAKPVQPAGANAPRAPPTAPGAQEQSTNKETGFKGWFTKTRHKISSALNKHHAGDDTVFATEGTTLKTDVAVVYGVPTDYPKGVIPSSKNDKSHPDRLFPGGRPFWLAKDETKTPTKMFVVSAQAQHVKNAGIKPTPPPKLDQSLLAAENIAEIKAKDDFYYKEIYKDPTCSLNQVTLNTVHNVYIASGKGKKNSSGREQASKYKRVKFVPPNQCSVYTRKEHKKKQTVTKHAFQPGLKKKITENNTKKKKKSGGSSGSGTKTE